MYKLCDKCKKEYDKSEKKRKKIISVNMDDRSSRYILFIKNNNIRAVI